MGVSESRRILVVEDDPSISLGLRMNLQAEGYTVTLADDGVVGLKLAQDEPWDAIILDVMLPGLNGFEIVKRLRSAEDDTPILMLTARGFSISKDELDKTNIIEVLSKPFSPRDILERVKSVFESQTI